jgi:hypothetical protein
MDAVAHLIMALHHRPDRIASALWHWLEQRDWTTRQLADYLGCTAATLERLALVPRPRPGPDWEDDVEIIAVSLQLNHDALRALLLLAAMPAEREFGA